MAEAGLKHMTLLLENLSQAEYQIERITATI